MRDWMHVFDHCAAIMAILKNGGDNEIYNIGAGQEFSNLEVIQKICNVMEKGYDLVEHVHDPRGNAHDFRYAVETKKIRSLGWKPNFKFKDGIENTVEWFVANQNQLFASSGN
jgi:dTDP-glucose 4,6-dehydratase